MEDVRRTTFPSTTGGVMTHEAGAITGELEVETRVGDGALTIRVRYAGTDEWYAVAGSPVAMDAPLSDLHERVVAHLRLPGPVVDGNEAAVSLW